VLSRMDHVVVTTVPYQIHHRHNGVPRDETLHEPITELDAATSPEIPMK